MLFGSSAQAQTVTRMDGATSIPLIERNNDGYEACGVRVIILGTAADDVYDFTMRLGWKVSSGLLDAKKLRITNGKIGKGMQTQIITPTPNKFWIVKETEAKALRPEKYGDSKIPGVMYAGLPLIPTFVAIGDIINGSRMQLSLDYSGNENRGDRVISFAAPLSKEDQVALKACLGTMAQSILDELEQAKSGNKKK